MLRGAACAIGSKAYFTAGGSSTVYCYDYISKQWTELSGRLMVTNFTFVGVNNLLTTVGGINSDKLFTHDGGKWIEKFRPMSIKRDNPAAVCTGHSLVVAGGKHTPRQYMLTVEVMDTITLQWFTAASIPKDMYWASMCACGDDLYLLGDESTHVYSCTLQSLLQSYQAPGKASTSQQTNVWSRITDLPVSESTAVTLCDQLISVGGVKDKKKVDSVYCYNPALSTWKIIGTIPSFESLPLVTTLPGDKMIVVYGNCQDITIAVASAVVR
jgi:hypothetical protein